MYQSPVAPRAAAGAPAPEYQPSACPVAPVGPCGPCGPVAPVAPVGPGGPCNPVAPVGPCGPCGPVAPCAPVAPVSPLTPRGTPNANTKALVDGSVTATLATSVGGSVVALAVMFTSVAAPPGETIETAICRLLPGSRLPSR